MYIMTSLGKELYLDSLPNMIRQSLDKTIALIDAPFVLMPKNQNIDAVFVPYSLVLNKAVNKPWSFVLIYNIVNSGFTWEDLILLF